MPRWRLIAGWQDVFLPQTLDEYRRLRDRGIRAALTIGPWTDFQMASQGGRRVFSEVFDWVDRHATGNRAARQRARRLPRHRST
jgi:predicted acyl esterase